MENIFVLPTDQPSRLHYYFELNKKYALSKEPLNWRTASHIYITSDEEIKDKDYVLSDTSIGALYLDSEMNTSSMLAEGQWKKVILTTDPTLIADGVQSIDDNFLEWFVKNPSCDFIEVKEKSPNEIEKELGIYGHDIGLTENEYSEWLKNGGQLYKIIIPQEEPKHETLEEAAKECYPIHNALQHSTEYKSSIAEKRLAFIFGAKWQAERMYSEEDMRKSFFQGWVTRERFDDQIPDIIYPQGLDYEEKQEYAFNLWFEQFKKK